MTNTTFKKYFDEYVSNAFYLLPEKKCEQFQWIVLLLSKTCFKFSYETKNHIIEQIPSVLSIKKVVF